jgi:hypothetical protein
MLAGLAVLPAVTGAAAATPLEDDPIFAAIAATREFEQTTEEAYARLADLRRKAELRFGSSREQFEAREDFIESLIGTAPDEYVSNYALPLWDHYRMFAETAPTTPAGLFAMLVYAGEVTERERDVLADMGILSTLATAARALSGRLA